MWDQVTPGHDEIMLWAACCLAFLGTLRAGELMVPSEAAFDDSVHLMRDDHNPKDSAVLRVCLKASEADPFRRGIFLFIGGTGSDVCPVAALSSYLLMRGQWGSPLFQFADGCFLTRQRFVAAVRDALGRAEVECSQYCGHIF